MELLQTKPNYLLWFTGGCIWGLTCQLAMAGTILLSMQYEIGSNILFGGFVCILFTTMNISGPFVVSFLILQLTSRTQANLEDSMHFMMIEEDTSESKTSSFILFSLLGSNVSSNKRNEPSYCNF